MKEHDNYWVDLSYEAAKYPELDDKIITALDAVQPVSYDSGYGFGMRDITIHCNDRDHGERVLAALAPVVLDLEHVNLGHEHVVMETVECYHCGLKQDVTVSIDGEPFDAGYNICPRCHNVVLKEWKV